MDPCNALAPSFSFPPLVFLRRLSFCAAASAMAGGILQHLDGAKLLLDMIPEGEQRTNVVIVQRDRVSTLLRNARLSTMEAARVAAAVKTVGFPEGDADVLVEAVTSRINDEASFDKKFQNYESFIKFLPAGLWKQLTPNNLFEFLSTKLGLAKPSEGTYQMMAVCLILASEGSEKAFGFTPGQKNEYLKAVKRWWASFKEHLPSPNFSTLLWLLPPSPQLLTSGDREKAYSGNDLPELPPIDVVSVERMRGGSWMRIHGPRKATQCTILATNERPLPPAQDSLPAAQMMQCVMGFMKDILMAPGNRQQWGGSPQSSNVLPGFTMCERGVPTTAVVPATDRSSVHAESPQGGKHIADPPRSSAECVESPTKIPPAQG